MAIFYKFKAAKDYSSISLDTPSIALFELKQRVRRVARWSEFFVILIRSLSLVSILVDFKTKEAR